MGLSDHTGYSDNSNNSDLILRLEKEGILTVNDHTKVVIQRSIFSFVRIP